MLDDTTFLMKIPFLITTQAANSAVSIATELALLVVLNCWMTWKNCKTNKINPNCLLYTLVTSVWVMKIQVNPLLQMPGNDGFYFRVMSMLYIKDKDKKTKKPNKHRRTRTKKEISAVKYVVSHLPNPEHPHLSFT